MIIQRRIFNNTGVITFTLSDEELETAFRIKQAEKDKDFIRKWCTKNNTNLQITDLELIQEEMRKNYDEDQTIWVNIQVTILRYYNNRGNKKQ